VRGLNKSHVDLSLVPEERECVMSVPAREASNRKSLVFSNETLESVMHHLATRAVEEIDDWQEASVSLIRDRQLQTFGPTSQKVLELDRNQYDTGIGPCVDCCMLGKEIYLPSTKEESPWPKFSAEAAEAGVGSTFSVPLRIDGQTIGGLNLYSQWENAKTPEGADIARAYADEASAILANADAHYLAQDLISQLNEALESRTIIGQATGILMGQEGLNSEEAFDKLRIASQHSNIKLREVAQRFVDTVDKGRG
jgi:hypothetical protein